MGLSDPVGQVSEGYLADLLLVSGNPLADVRILQNPDNFMAIVKDGEFHKCCLGQQKPLSRRCAS